MTDPNYSEIETCIEHAEVRIMQAEFVDGATGEVLYQQATDLLIQAEGLMKGSGAWLMSCMHARRGNAEMCVQWLERARKSSMLPDLETIITHTHFAGVLEKRWFKDWAKHHR